MQDFKKLRVWEESHKLNLMIYSITKNFPDDEKYVLVNQIRRASISVPSNIAEGSGKNSDKDKARFMQIALGSLHEVEYQVILSKDLNYIEEQKFEEINKHLNTTKAMLINFIKTLKP